MCQGTLYIEHGGSLEITLTVPFSHTYLYPFSRILPILFNHRVVINIIDLYLSGVL